MINVDAKRDVEDGGEVDIGALRWGDGRGRDGDDAIVRELALGAMRIGIEGGTREKRQQVVAFLIRVHKGRYFS